MTGDTVDPNGGKQAIAHFKIQCLSLPGLTGDPNAQVLCLSVGSLPESMSCYCYSVPFIHLLIDRFQLRSIRSTHINRVGPPTKRHDVSVPRQCTFPTIRPEN